MSDEQMSVTSNKFGESKSRANTSAPDEHQKLYPSPANKEQARPPYDSNGLVITELPLGPLSEESVELERLATISLEQLKDFTDNAIPPAHFDKYPEIQARAFLISDTMHELGKVNNYSNPPWDKAWTQDGTPEADRFWNEYLNRTTDQIISEGFWACSDVATVYVGLARKLKLDAHFVSAVTTEWINGTQEADPNQHAFAEIRSSNAISLIYEPFEANPKAVIQRTDDGFKLYIRDSGGSHTEMSLATDSPDTDWSDALNLAYETLGYIPWRKDSDPKGIGVNGLSDMIEQVRTDFGMQIQDARKPPDGQSEAAFKERIVTDGLLAKLQSIKNTLGPYSRQDILPRYISIQLVDGEEGLAPGYSSDIQDPADTTVSVPLANLSEGVQSVLSKAQQTDLEITEQQAREVVIANASSITLHEATHQLIHSDPEDSPLVSELTESLGLETLDEETNLLVNEGITYAFHSIYAPHQEPFGSMGPRIEADDSDIIKSRKLLGQKLEIIIREYQSQNKTLDREFIHQASQALREAQLSSH